MCNMPMPAPFYGPTTTERTALVKLLRSAGLKLSTARIHILHYLHQTNAPQTAETMSQQACLPLSTTYRALAALETYGLTGILFGSAGVARWYLIREGRPQRCNSCGQRYSTEYV
ncbi:hypothetical protein LVQ77_22125 [Buttiauxella sp. S04-F03]|uniref:hypothetical protein n=1 Tax=Buttiauxella sp. W03-F01 TaxID=2904524 RepID=UPI001E65C580|nr:hypothetical protein [Buttiauxella sp. W03-F01]MCE0802965.1 hypothetical protein [Buttiauxella sp. W03-F01]